MAMKGIISNGIPASGPAVAPPNYESVAAGKNSLIFAHPLSMNLNPIGLPLNIKPIIVDLCKTQWFFLLLITVTIVAVFNLIITFWIIKALQLSSDGIGHGTMILNNRGINIRGDSKFIDQLNAKTIKPFNEKNSIDINSGPYATIVLKNDDYIDNSLILGNDKLEIQASNFQIRATDPTDSTIAKFNLKDDLLFSVEPNEICTYTDNFVSPALGGYKIINSLETNSIRGGSYNDLRIESRTHSVSVHSQGNVQYESPGGDIQIMSYDDIQLNAKEWIILNTQRVEMTNLPKAISNQLLRDETIPNAYQVCLCDSGRLFVISSSSVCKISNEWCNNEQTIKNY